MRRIYHIARADFLQRVRSRKLVIVLAVVAFFGYLVNVGQIEIAYQIQQDGSLVNIGGTNTAEFVGLKAGLTGATVLLFGGFYLMNSQLERDRRNNIDRLVASTRISDWGYLAGKWVSNVGLGVVILAVLGFATVVNHLVHGVGGTEFLALLGPLVVFGLPVAALVGAVAVLFETIGVLNGTGGNIAYFFLAVFALAGLNAAEGRLPDTLPVWLKAIDTLGQLAVYELTVDALHTQVPTYTGGPPSFGTLSGGEQVFEYTGHPWPLWIFVQRVWLLLPALLVLSAAAISFDRFRSTDTSEGSRWLSRITTVVPRVGSSDTPDESAAEPPAIEALSFTSVDTRDAGSFWRLVVAETRLAVRGRRWWWYGGTAMLVLVPLGSLLPAGFQTVPVDGVRRVFLPLVFIWPIFLWSDIGIRTVRHRMTDLVFSSKYSFEQLLAEWLSGVVVAVGVSSGALVLFVVTGQVAPLLGIASGVLFGPSLAIAIGTWSRSSELFEMAYLLLWYAGPLNGGEAIDFVGATVRSVELGVPFAFIGLSVLLLGVGLLRRKTDHAL
jgi:ABC-type transport system involved in multi-copper enzyme maturation permease subunit